MRVMELIHNTKYKFEFLMNSFLFFFFQNVPKVEHFPSFRKCFGMFCVFVKEIVILILDSDSLY